MQAIEIFASKNIKEQLSIFSHNIHSLNAKYENLTMLLDDFDSPFSIIALQEVWSLGRDFSLTNYHPPPLSATRDENFIYLNPNCGGGGSLYVHQDLNMTQIHFDNQFVKAIYESLWVLLTFGNNKIIVGNIY